MRIRIIVSYVPRYRAGHRFQFVPPVTGIHLAALVPEGHEVEVVHEQIAPAPLDDLPDLVAISFFSGFARRAYEVADAYRALGVRVVAGGPHASYWPEEALAHFDSVVIGEADEAWPRLIADAERGRLERAYHGSAAPLEGLPMPRYDLLEPEFVVPRVLQATRGCPFRCTFCTVPDLNPGFRVRPVGDVVRDIAQSRFRNPLQDKVAWFWDDNLLVQRRWAKELLREMRGLKTWWLTQASIDITKDAELLDLMQESGCIGIFLGIESLDAEGLASVDKRQNKVSQYRDAIARLHDRGICVMAGFIAGLDDQTPETVVGMADRLQGLGIDVPFLSILTPFRGTPLYDDMLRAGRVLPDRDWPHYNGYNVAFEPARMSPAELLAAHRALWQRAFSPRAVLGRLARGAAQLRPGALMLSAAMNGFYGHKQVRGNLPAEAAVGGAHRIAHPDPAEPPRRLVTLSRRAAA
jgi:radical SAM superfamily enzyme YgiQ (UPF0313 family)